ncbi:hypothetical protein LUZ63_007832 [Rhynchospora breviuscula]|uniref:Reverse transcriptase zinc-binding domain-containing protein n=1 Tax=Rhynchospora breviuscula TaxID=2022672 RepID=A0A9Q0CT16_9POAL|nr:hypothetical protein LUZ63_007832 [Rhynchospora breviuscula]
MAMVSWKSITVPRNEGGLVLKDLFRFAQSVHMKFLWNLVSENSALWVKLVQAKYLQRGNIWSSSRRNRCIPFWKAILAARPLLKNHVRRQIGDGNTCRAVGQPWHDLWANYLPQNAAQKSLLVKDLMNEEGVGWSNERLIEAFGYHGALHIAITYPVRPSLIARPDRLLFTAARNGIFSLKSAYSLLSAGPAPHPTGASQHNKIYDLIWHAPGILPRARLFVWKALKESLPVDSVLAYRLSRPTQGCALCGHSIENVVHALFKCPVAKQVWLTSTFGLRTDALPDTALDLFSFLSQSLQPTQFASLISVAWHYWKYRCKQVIEGIKFSPQQVLMNAQAWTNLLLIQGKSCQRHDGNMQSQLSGDLFLCYTDGSWVHEGVGGAGMAYIMFSGDNTLIQYQMEVGQAHYPFHAEFLTLRLAADVVAAKGLSGVGFLTDRLHLCRVMNGISSIDSVDWQVYIDVMMLISRFRGESGWKCVHVNRQDN